MFDTAIIRDIPGEVSLKTYGRVCVFCHYDNDNIIGDHVVHYLRDLAANDSVLFVSNSENVSESELMKIKPYVVRMMVRRNIGYDFAAYFTGYLIAKQMAAQSAAQWSHLIFANDSVFGPFYPLKQVFERMDAQSHDMWGISDALAGRYHIQSYFWSFAWNERTRAFLDREVEQFHLLERKEDIVEAYEVGITQRLVRGQFRTGVLCSNAQAAQFERWEANDAMLARIKTDMLAAAQSKITLSRTLRGLLSSKVNRRNEMIPDAHTYLTGINSCWYSMIKYFGAPFIKVALLKCPQTFRYHHFAYLGLLREIHPNFDLALIETHLNRTRTLGN